MNQDLMKLLASITVLSPLTCDAHAGTLAWVCPTHRMLGTTLRVDRESGSRAARFVTDAHWENASVPLRVARRPHFGPV